MSMLLPMNRMPEKKVVSRNDQRIWLALLCLWKEYTVHTSKPTNISA